MQVRVEAALTTADGLHAGLAPAGEGSHPYDAVRDGDEEVRLLHPIHGRVAAGRWQGGGREVETEMEMEMEMEMGREMAEGQGDDREMAGAQGAYS